MICKKAKEELKRVLAEEKKYYEEQKYWDRKICPKCGNRDLNYVRSDFAYKCNICGAKGNYTGE